MYNALTYVLFYCSGREPSGSRHPVVQWHMLLLRPHWVSQCAAVHAVRRHDAHRWVVGNGAMKDGSMLPLIFEFIFKPVSSSDQLAEIIIPEA